MDREKQTRHQYQPVDRSRTPRPVQFRPAQGSSSPQPAQQYRPKKRRSPRLVAGIVIAIILICIGGGVTWAQIGPQITQNSATAVNLQKGLIGWWKYDGNVNDATPNRKNGTPTNLTTTSDREGKANSAYSFNGTSSYVTYGTTPNFNRTSLTFSAWIKPGSVTGSQTIVAKELQYKIRMSGNTIQALISTNGTSWVGASTFAGGTLAQNVWQHVALTIDNTTLQTRLYVNGQQVANNSIPSSISTFNANPLSTGVYQTSTNAKGEYFTGSMDDIRFYNRALNANEMKALYGSYNPAVKIAAGENGMVGWWKMDNSPKDATPYRNNATPTAVTVTTDREGKANSAYSFNGTSSVLAVGKGQNLSFTDNFTMSAWIKPTTVKTGQPFGLQNMIMARGPATTYNYALQVTSDTSISFIKRTGSEGLMFYTYNAAPSLTGKWTMVTATVLGGSLKLYINGALVWTSPVGTIGPNVSGNDTLNIGGTAGVSTGYFTGSLDDVRVYKRALAANEISAQYKSYNSQIAVNSVSSQVNLSSGLVGYWPLNNALTDATPYRSNISSLNGGSYTTDRKGRANSAYVATTSNTLNTNFTQRLSRLTASIWVKADGTYMNSFGTFFSNTRDCCAVYRGFQMDVKQSTGLVTGRIWTGGGGPNSISSATATMDLNTWNLWTLTYDGSNMRLYKNATQVATATLTGDIGMPSYNVYINRMGYTSGYSLGAAYDDARIYNRALSASEVSALYNEYR